jgi:crossover junction endodeoxyribonuclease RuvC
MRILGLDPGSVVLGYGLVEDAARVSLVDCGVIKASPRLPVEHRLAILFDGICKLIETHKPDEVAIEEPFAGVNVRSAFMIGRAQALGMLAAARSGIPIACYSPATVKQQVSGYGMGDKEQVRSMVALELNTRNLPPENDATDALAVALCHLHHLRANKLISRVKR